MWLSSDNPIVSQSSVYNRSLSSAVLGILMLFVLVFNIPFIKGQNFIKASSHLCVIAPSSLAPELPFIQMVLNAHASTYRLYLLNNDGTNADSNSIMGTVTNGQPLFVDPKSTNSFCSGIILTSPQLSYYNISSSPPTNPTSSPTTAPKITSTYVSLMTNRLRASINSILSSTGIRMVVINSDIASMGDLLLPPSPIPPSIPPSKLALRYFRFKSDVSFINNLVPLPGPALSVNIPVNATSKTYVVNPNYVESSTTIGVSNALVLGDILQCSCDESEAFIMSASTSSTPAFSVIQPAMIIFKNTTSKGITTSELHILFPQSWSSLASLYAMPIWWTWVTRRSFVGRRKSFLSIHIDQVLQSSLSQTNNFVTRITPSDINTFITDINNINSNNFNSIFYNMMDSSVYSINIKRTPSVSIIPELALVGLEVNQYGGPTGDSLFKFLQSYNSNDNNIYTSNVLRYVSNTYFNTPFTLMSTFVSCLNSVSMNTALLSSYLRPSTTTAWDSLVIPDGTFAFSNTQLLLAFSNANIKNLFIDLFSDIISSYRGYSSTTWTFENQKNCMLNLNNYSGIVTTLPRNGVAGITVIPRIPSMIPRSAATMEDLNILLNPTLQPSNIFHNMVRSALLYILQYRYDPFVFNQINLSTLTTTNINPIYNTIPRSLVTEWLQLVISSYARLSLSPLNSISSSEIGAMFNQRSILTDNACRLLDIRMIYSTNLVDTGAVDDISSDSDSTSYKTFEGIQITLPKLSSPTSSPTPSSAASSSPVSILCSADVIITVPLTYPSLVSLPQYNMKSVINNNYERVYTFNLNNDSTNILRKMDINDNVVIFPAKKSLRYPNFVFVTDSELFVTYYNGYYYEFHLAYRGSLGVVQSPDYAIFSVFANATISTSTPRLLVEGGVSAPTPTTRATPTPTPTTRGYFLPAKVNVTDVNNGQYNIGAVFPDTGDYILNVYHRNLTTNSELLIGSKLVSVTAAPVVNVVVPSLLPLAPPTPPPSDNSLSSSSVMMVVYLLIGLGVVGPIVSFFVYQRVVHGRFGGTTQSGLEDKIKVKPDMIKITPVFRGKYLSVRGALSGSSGKTSNIVQNSISKFKTTMGMLNQEDTDNDKKKKKNNLDNIPEEKRTSSRSRSRSRSRRRSSFGKMASMV